jgi:hypothetical protein
LEKLELSNIIGLTERFPPAPISLQWIQPGFPSDPKPSLSAFERSLNVWKRELKGLTEADVIVDIQFHGGREAAVENWLEESEVQALASAMGVTLLVDLAVVEGDPLYPSRVLSWIEFNWGAWILCQDHPVV